MHEIVIYHCFVNLLQELRDLEAAYQAKRRLMVDEALNKLHGDYDKQRADLLKKHQQELAALQVCKIFHINYLAHSPC